MAVSDYFQNAALDLLHSAATVLGVDDAPASQFIIIGSPVAPAPGEDCAGQLTVGVAGTVPSRTPLQRDATGNQANCNVVTLVSLTVTLFECSPTMDDLGNIDPVAIQTQALNMYRIMGKLWFGILALGRGAFPSLPALTCNGINYGAISPGTNSGGAAGVSWTITLSVG